MALRILITNTWMWPPSGTVLYVRDLALELLRRGHEPTIFSSTHGEVVSELRAAGVTVTDRLDRLLPPDLIHANHRAPFLIAAERWPRVPAIYVCHAHDPQLDAPPLHPSVRRYFGVSRLCVRRVADAGVPEGEIGLLLNSVDTLRFQPRSSLPERPGRALVFSNYARRGTHLPAVLAACREAGIDVDVAGEGSGNLVLHPETVLPAYDLVFAKARAAMEAMAVGAAVMLCDQTGLGPMVTTADFDALRPVNFGFEALRDRLDPALLMREIARYDPADAAAVRDRLRSEASLGAAVDELEAIYAEVRDTPMVATRPRASAGRAALLRQWAYLRLFWTWYRLPRRRRDAIKSLPGVPGLIAAIRRLA